MKTQSSDLHRAAEQELNNTIRLARFRWRLEMYKRAQRVLDPERIELFGTDCMLLRKQAD